MSMFVNVKVPYINAGCQIQRHIHNDKNTLGSYIACRLSGGGEGGVCVN